MASNKHVDLRKTLLEVNVILKIYRKIKGKLTSENLVKIFVGHLTYKGEKR